MKFETRNLESERLTLRGRYSPGLPVCGWRVLRGLTGKIPVLLSFVLLSSSCAIIPLPEHAVDVPEAYRAATNGVALVANWWTEFGDEQLDELMDTTLAGNLSIEQAAARLRQAQATAVKNGADRFPSLTGSGKGQTTYAGSKDSDTSTTDNFSLGLSASYELDLWGRVASTRKAALRSMDSSYYDLQTAAMTIAAKTVDT
jgi:outer membrane protein TolC